MGYYTNNGGLLGTTRIDEKKGVYDLVCSQHNNTLFAFSEFTFTSPNQDPFAPTSTEITNQSAYSSSNFASNTSFFQVSEGIQYFTIPRTTNYTITAKGAAGKNINGASYEGSGGIIRASFSLEAGTILGILVGQRPPTSVTYLWQGGGGGTFVTTVSSVGSNETATPLIVAGGGAGARYSSPSSNVNGNMSPNGNSGNGTNGGTQGDHAVAGGLNASGGGGAAGWDGIVSSHGDCRQVYTPSGYPQSSTCSIAYPGARGFNSSSDPGQGGIFNISGNTNFRGSGGFGGGGPGGWGGAGGAGGYSGGGNGNNTSTEYAGGGGSFISSSAIDTSASGKEIGTSTGSWSDGSGAFSGHSILSTASGLVNLGYNAGNNGSVLLERW